MLSDIFQWTGQSPLPNCPAPNVSCAKGEKPWLKAKALKSERTGFESRLCHTLPSSSWATCLNSEPQVLHLSNGVNSNAYLRKMTGGIHEITGYKEPEAYVLLIFHVSRAWVGLVLDLPPKAKSSVCWRRGSRVVRMRTLESERQSGLHLLPVRDPGKIAHLLKPQLPHLWNGDDRIGWLWGLKELTIVNVLAQSLVHREQWVSVNQCYKIRISAASFPGGKQASNQTETL